MSKKNIFKIFSLKTNIFVRNILCYNFCVAYMKSSTKKNSFFKISFFDKLGISATTICFIHCLIVPFLLPLLSTLGLGYLFHEGIEFIFFIISFVVALFSLSVGFVKYHKKWQPYFLFFLATLIFIVNFFFSNHDHHGNHDHGTAQDFIFIFLIAIFIIASHLMNIYFCKKCSCCKNDKSS